MAVTMIDATGACAPSVPAGTAKVAGYVTGSAGICWTAADWDRFHGSRVRIDQSPDLSAFAAGNADVADIENGAGTAEAAAAAVAERQKNGRYSTAYVSAANLPALRDALSAVVTNQVGFWVANWDLSEAEAAAQLGNEIVAVQWASPASNPGTLMPGSALTLAKANADLSVTLAGWYPPPAPAPAWQATALSGARSLAESATALAALLGAHQ
jgi:hypothetical protein